MYDDISVYVYYAILNTLFYIYQQQFFLSWLRNLKTSKKP